MKQLVDIDNWKRKENYLFFRNFANPYYTVTSFLDVSKDYDTSKCLVIKFSQFLMYASLKAVNEIEFLRYRQIDGKVWLFDSIRLNTAVSLPDHSFISVIVPYKSSLKEFVMSIQEQIDLARKGLGDAYGLDSEKDVIVISINPWYSFTGMQFQFPENAGENMPLSIFGKVTEDNGIKKMPVAMSFHHGFVDGYYVGQYWEKFQQNLNTPYE